MDGIEDPYDNNSPSTPRSAAGSLGEQLWSPVQNLSLWIGAWMAGHVSTDDVIAACHDVSGRRHRLVLASEAENPELGFLHARHGLIELLKHIQRRRRTGEIALSLILAGPGAAPRIPASSPAAGELMESGVGVALGTDAPDEFAVFLPWSAPDRVLGDAGAAPAMADDAVEWRWYEVSGYVQPLVVNSVGEAHMMLRDAADTATAEIKSIGFTPLGNSGIERAELAVGSLHDAFGLPGLPPLVPSRAEQLLARADMVAAIVEVARRSNIGAQLDVQLLPMLQAIRVARMTAVEYTIQEWSR